MVSPRHIILCTQCDLHRGTCLNAMKRFYFREVASSSLKKTTTTVIRNFQPVVLVFLYSIPGVVCLSGGAGIASSS